MGFGLYLQILKPTLLIEDQLQAIRYYTQIRVFESFSPVVVIILERHFFNSLNNNFSGKFNDPKYLEIFSENKLAFSSIKRLWKSNNVILFVEFSFDKVSVPR